MNGGLVLALQWTPSLLLTGAAAHGSQDESGRQGKGQAVSGSRCIYSCCDSLFLSLMATSVVFRASTRARWCGWPHIL